MICVLLRAILQDGGVFTCGAGMYGQLGHGAFTNEVLPRKVVELMGSTVTQISCGRYDIRELGRLFFFFLKCTFELIVSIGNYSPITERKIYVHFNYSILPPPFFCTPTSISSPVLHIPIHYNTFQTIHLLKNVISYFHKHLSFVHKFYFQ